jgi:hypothetical protein
MSTARIVVLTIALGVGGIAASAASASAKQAETLADAVPRGNAVAGAATNISDDQASRHSESVDGVPQRIAIPTTAQK